MSAKRKTSNKPYDKDLFCFVLGIFFLGGGGSISISSYNNSKNDTESFQYDEWLNSN